MKFLEVFRYEVSHRLRSPSTWLYCAVLFGIAFMLFRGGTPSSDGVNENAPIQLALFSLLFGSLFGLPVTAALFSGAAVRDVRAEMDPLVYTSPLRKAEYLGGRYLAALTINAVLLLAIPIGFAVPILMGYPDASVLGPFRIAAYVQPYVFILLPNVVLTGAILFTIGVLTRQVIPVYLGAIAVFMICMITVGPAEDAVNSTLSVVGPFGFHALNELTEYWTAAERNARLIGFPASLVWNRVFTLAVSAAVLALLHARFRFAHPDGGRRWRRRRRPVVAAVPARAAERGDRVHPRIEPEPAHVQALEEDARDRVEIRARVAAPVAVRRVAGSFDLRTMARQTVAVPRVAGSFGLRTTARQVLAVTRRSVAELAMSRWFAVVLAACVILTMIWGWNVGDTVFDTSTWPVTLLVAGTVLSQRATLLVYLLIVLYAGELVWKEREAGTAEIADAAPVPDGVALLGRFLALAAMLVMIQAASMVGGILIQAFQGYYNFEIGLYLRVVFGLNLINYLLIAALVMTIHVLANQKYVGHIIALLALFFTKIAGELGIRHHLLVYGTDPGWTYSDMNGFGPFVGPFVWFKLYWAAWSLLLAVGAALFWVRGREPGLRHRVDEALARFSKPVGRATGAAFTLIVLLGGFVFYNTNILNEYRTTDEVGAWQADYESRYGRFEDIPQPIIASADLRIEIYPEEPGVDLRGTYSMVNGTSVAIDSVHVFTVQQIEVGSISFDRAADPVLVDDEVGYRIYSLERPLAAGDTLQLEFDVSFRPHGFPNDGMQTDVVRNGAYFDRRWLPIIGYQPYLELSDDEARARFGLAPRASQPSHDDVEARRYRYELRDADRVQVSTVVGTSADQIAVAPGVLRRSWTEDGRRYFHYETDSPIPFGATVFSASYALLEDRWNDVDLTVFHHPAHTENLDRTVRSMKASLEYYTQQFGPYLGQQLRVVEIPRYGSFGRAHPQTIAFTEDALLSRVRDGEVDQPFYGTAHETAHMWWGGQVRSATGLPGAGFISESLANYSAMMVTEKTYGPEIVRKVYDIQMQRYLSGRANFSREVPLLEVRGGQPYIAYRKGAIAMYTLREHIGEQAVNTALRRFLEKYRDAGPPYPTSFDLYAELRAVTSDSLQYLLTDWFETITLWDVRAEQAVIEPTGTGEYRVTINVSARKMRADSLGNETEVPMDDLVEIGVYAQGEGNRLGEPLYLERHRIRSGEQTIRVTVPREPARAGVDPYRKLIDRRRVDNVVEVEGRSEMIYHP